MSFYPGSPRRKQLKLLVRMTGNMTGDRTTNFQVLPLHHPSLWIPSYENILSDKYNYIYGHAT
jgi:hypothetical protein